VTIDDDDLLAIDVNWWLGATAAAASRLTIGNSDAIGIKTNRNYVRC